MSVEDIGPVRGVSTEPPALGEVVKKRGSRTLLTGGFVVGLVPSASVPAISYIEFIGAVPFVSVFAGHGDSGSVVLNECDEVISLLFAIPGEDLGTDLSSGGFAMPIHNVHLLLALIHPSDPWPLADHHTSRRALSSWSVLSPKGRGYKAMRTTSPRPSSWTFAPFITDSSPSINIAPLIDTKATRNERATANLS
jgi:hypothetical protein